MTDQSSRMDDLAQQVRVSGVLDMLRASSRTYALRLPDGTEVAGVLTTGDAADLSPLLGRSVLVLGKSIFGGDGSLIRIDAQEIRPASDADGFFSRAPAPRRAAPDLEDLRRRQQAKGGIAAIIGTWPGDETDEQIDAALKELS